MTAIGHTNPYLAPYVIEARRLGRIGAAVLAFGLLPVLAWLALAPLSSAVIAHAFVKVDLDRRPVQHAEGGIIREVKVRDGQRVAQGEPLIILGDVAVDADLSRLTYRLQAERASGSRLEAEQVALSAVAFPPDLLAAASTDARLAEQLAKERALFFARRDALRDQTALLREQRERVVQESAAVRAQIAKASESLQHQEAELAINRKLIKDGFVSLARISQLEASVADYAARLEEKRSEAARAEQRLIDVDLRVKSLEGEYRQQASDQLKITTTRIAEIQEELRNRVRFCALQPARLGRYLTPSHAPGAQYRARPSLIEPKDPAGDRGPTAPKT
jgi:HlyD family type I secretion membrane fusion protein